MGALIGLNAASQVGFMHLFGRVTDRFGRKPPLIAGMVVAGFASLVFSVSVLPATLRFRVVIVVIGCLLIGASYSSVVTATTSYISDIAPAQRRSELLGFQSTAQGVGGIVGPPLVGLLATATEYETAFAVFSVLCSLAAFIVLSGLIESHPNVRAKAQS
jgi:MFS family permease